MILSAQSTGKYFNIMPGDNALLCLPIVGYSWENDDRKSNHIGFKFYILLDLIVLQ